MQHEYFEKDIDNLVTVSETLQHKNKGKKEANVDLLRMSIASAFRKTKTEGVIKKKIKVKKPRESQILQEKPKYEEMKMEWPE